MGINDLGINGLAKRASMTSGAFYDHFASKNKAF
ncbi:TetR family transcriptional regulator [Agaribacterium sp. ZY112]